MARGLDPTFMNDLQCGKLKPFLKLVQEDNTLDLEIRENYINIYYRGASIDRIELNGKGEYEHDFNPKYGFSIDKDKVTISDFLKMKEAIDKYLSKKEKKVEREFQQLIIRENNYSSIANSTDYYIADIETAKKEGRYDMVAVKWHRSNRRNNFDLDLALIEVKYGEGALRDKKDNGSGIIGHLEKSNEIDIKSLQDEMIMCFNQKRDLDLFSPTSEGTRIKNIESFKNQPNIDFIFILANQNPASTILKDEIDKINPDKYPKLNIKFAVSNFMGYGLYEDNIYNLKDFKEKFKETIYNGKQK